MTSFFLILIGIFLLDFSTKSLVRALMPLGSEISILPVFSLTHIENTGVAFGFFQGRNGLFLVVGILVVIALLAVGIQSYKHDRFFAITLAGVIGGAFGNLTDRLFFGRVTDFLDFYVGRFHWPAFNVADSAICVGAALILWRSVKHP